MTAVPDLIEPVAVWRVWHVRDRGDGLELVSPVRPVRWPRGRVMTATCAGGCARSPSLTCSCGLYGMSELHGLDHEPRGTHRVLGVTALWGRVVEHTLGFRGEHGYPLVLLLFPDSGLRRGVLLRALREQFDHGEDGSDLAYRSDGADAALVTQARSLADRYRVPVRAVPDPTPFAHDARAARVVRDEAVRGLAARRAGHAAAHDRLDVALDDLLRHDDGRGLVGAPLR